MGIVDDDIAKVRSATDIVSVISEHLQLKRVGQRWVGLCPFHNEKSPSFSVNGQLGFYHCFGCQASGDAISFVREIEGLDFVGAVERLAAKANVTLTYTSADEGKQRRRRARLVEAVDAAATWYHERLLEAPDAGAARAYLRSRGITGDEVRAYRIGWAPDDWDLVTRHLRRTGVAEDVLIDAGVGFQNRRGRLQDTFRARILFPIHDVNNDTVGFGGRKLPDTDGPKYKNSSDSRIYAKSRLLYGLNWAKEHIVRADEVIVCEGYTDVIGFARAGVPRAVATCGTALTEDHVRILKRFASRIVLSFDADAAGQAAADRFYEWERRYEIDVRVAALPAGVDPGDLAQRDPDALAASVAEAEPFLAFRVRRVLEGGDMTTVEGRARAAEDACELVAVHPSPLVRDQYLMQIADRTGIDVDRLRENRGGAGDRGSESRRARREQRRVGGGEPTTPPSGSRPQAPAIRVDTVEAQVLRVAVHQPHLLPDLVTPVLFADEINRSVFDTLLMSSSIPDALAHLEGSPGSRRLSELIAMPYDTDGDVDADIAGRLAAQLVYAAASEQVERLKQEAQRTGDPGIGIRMAAVKQAMTTVRDTSWKIDAAQALLLLLTATE